VIFWRPGSRTGANRGLAGPTSRRLACRLASLLSDGKSVSSLGTAFARTSFGCDGPKHCRSGAGCMYIIDRRTMLVVGASIAIATGALLAIPGAAGSAPITLGEDSGPTAQGLAQDVAVVARSRRGTVVIGPRRRGAVVVGPRRRGAVVVAPARRCWWSRRTEPTTSTAV